MRKNTNIRYQKIFDCIVAFKMAHDGNSPTFREIGESIGCNSSSLISIYLDRMEILGMIKRDQLGASRNIEIPGGKWIPPSKLNVDEIVKATLAGNSAKK